jgi:hypothetical protein
MRRTRVIDGLMSFQRTHPELLVPVLQGFGKTILCRPEQRRTYFEWFARGYWQRFLRRDDFRTRVTRFIEHDVFVFNDDDGWLAGNRSRRASSVIARSAGLPADPRTYRKALTPQVPAPDRA